MKKTAINYSELDISRLSKGIHRVLKNKGCQDVKLGWINEGISKSLGFNNYHDFLKTEKPSNKNTIQMKRKTIIKIIDHCFEMFDIHNVKLIRESENIEKKKELTAELIDNLNHYNSLFDFINTADSTIKLGSSILFLNVILSILNKINNNEYQNVNIIDLKNLVRYGSNIDFNNEEKYCFINLLIPSLILSEENNKNIDLFYYVSKEKNLEATKLFFGLSQLEINFKELLENEFDFYNSSLQETRGYYLNKMRTSEISENMWTGRAIHLLNLVIEGIFIMKKTDKNLIPDITTIINFLEINGFKKFIFGFIDGDFGYQPRYVSKLKEYITKFPYGILEKENFINNNFIEQHGYLANGIKRTLIKNSSYYNIPNNIESKIFNIVQ